MYFAATSPLSPLLGGVFAGFCYVFVELGRISDGDILKYSFKKMSKFFFLALIQLSNLIIYIAMLAGSEYIFQRLLGISGGTIISAVFCLVCIYMGVNKLKLLNAVAVPMMFVLIVFLYIKVKPPILPFQSFALHTPILYACMNILSGGYLISTFAKGLKPSDSVNISLIVTVIISSLLVLIYLLIQDCFNMPMPMLFTASAVGLIELGCIILYLAVFTTLVGSLYIITGPDMKKAMLFTSIGLVVSVFGFKGINRQALPAYGIFGFFPCAVRHISACFQEKKIFRRHILRFKNLKVAEAHHAYKLFFNFVQIPRGVIQQINL